MTEFGPGFMTRGTKSPAPSSEFERIRWLKKLTSRLGHPPRGGRLLIGIGDDAALWSPPAGNAVVLTTDSQVEGVHFRREWLSPHQIGARAVAAAASDIAAMAATPGGVLLSFTLPRETPDSFFRALFRGALQEACRNGLAVLGGNLSCGPLTLSVTAVGSVHARRAVLRSGARPGHGLYVTGWPGRSRLGLAVLTRGSPGRTIAHRRAVSLGVRAFAEPHPRIEEALFLAREADPRAMLDLSDGLAQDLEHILGADAALGRGLGAVLDGGRMADLFKKGGCGALARRLGLDPLDLVLEGGEDYELLFAAPAGRPERIAERFRRRFGIPLTRIGTVEARPGLRLEGRRGRITAAGHDHFRG